MIRMTLTRHIADKVPRSSLAQPVFRRAVGAVTRRSVVERTCPGPGGRATASATPSSLGFHCAAYRDRRLQAADELGHNLGRWLCPPDERNTLSCPHRKRLDLASSPDERRRRGVTNDGFA